MQEFMLIFRHSASPDYNPSPEALQESIKDWQEWIGKIAEQGKFKSTNMLGYGGVSLKGDVITDGPYAEIKETVGGYLILEANSIEEATEWAKSCPMIAIGGIVEIRPIMKLD